MNYSSLETEKYISISNHRYKDALCKLRVSAHNLEIETGRFLELHHRNEFVK